MADFVRAVDQGTTSTRSWSSTTWATRSPSTSSSTSRPVVAETTALGAAYAAGLAAGFWRDTTELRANWRESRRWEPTWSADRRAAGHADGRKAVDRALDWVDVG